MKKEESKEDDSLFIILCYAMLCYALPYLSSGDDVLKEWRKPDANYIRVGVLFFRLYDKIYCTRRTLINSHYAPSFPRQRRSSMQIGATLLWLSHKIYNYITPAMIIQLVPYVHTNASPIPTSFFLSFRVKWGKKKGTKKV